MRASASPGRDRNPVGSASRIAVMVSATFKADSMARKPKNEMLPGVKGVQIDLDDRDNPTYCLVGLVTEEGVKSFTLHPAGASMMIQALQTFLDRVDGKPPAPQPRSKAN